MQKENVILYSSGPITDGGRKYNFFYIIGLVVAVVWAIILGKIGFLITTLAVSEFIALVIKNIVCEYKCRGLRGITFNCKKKISYEQLIQNLQPILLPLNMTIEKDTGGEPVITYKGVSYGVTYNEDNTFCIYWWESVAKALLTGELFYIRLYRKVSVAYGIIAYNIQKICDEQNQNYQKDKDSSQQNIDGKICPGCGNLCKKESNFCVCCGLKLDIVDLNTEKQKQNFCEHCRKPVKPDDKFCIHCGSQL